MKSIEEQKADKAAKVSELMVELSKCIANALDTELSDEERGKYALRAMIINQVDLPLVIQTSIQHKEFPKGGMSTIGEEGPELLWQSNEDGEFKIRLQKGDRIIRHK